MKKLVNYISIALLTWIAFGCTDEQIVNHTGTELRVTGEIESPSRTIYTETDKAVTVSWAAGDRIGLFSEEQPEAMAYQAASEGKQTEFTPESIRLKKKEGTEALRPARRPFLPLIGEAAAWSSSCAFFCCFCFSPCGSCAPILM